MSKYKIKFVGMRGPFTDYNGNPIPNIKINENDFSKIRKKYNIKKEEYDEMIICVGVWVVNRKNNCKSFVFVSTCNGTPKMIVISELFLKELLDKYKNYDNGYKRITLEIFKKIFNIIICYGK